MQTFPFRLMPGQDLKKEIDALVLQENWSAACMLSAVGSLTEVAIRFANQEKATLMKGRFEILSLCGTLSPHGSHLHISVADEVGKVTGGHLKEGAIVYTTAELVICVLNEWDFTRLHCPESGFLELVVKKKQSGGI